MNSPFSSAFGSLAIACALSGWGIPLSALAQAPDGVAVEQARIVAERNRADAIHRQEEKACYGTFAVNDCLKAAKAKRRESLADLRRQEVALNDAERRRRAAERLRDIEERAAETAPPRPPAVQRPAGKPAESAAEKAGRQEQAAGRQLRGQEKQAKQAAQKDERAIAAPRNRERHDARVQEAAERRAKLDKRLADRKKPAAQPLQVEP